MADQGGLRTGRRIGMTNGQLGEGAAERRVAGGDPDRAGLSLPSADEHPAHAAVGGLVTPGG
jgi:hypothetical protein